MRIEGNYFRSKMVSSNEEEILKIPKVSMCRILEIFRRLLSFMLEKNVTPIDSFLVQRVLAQQADRIRKEPR